MKSHELSNQDKPEEKLSSVKKAIRYLGILKFVFAFFFSMEMIDGSYSFYQNPAVDRAIF